MIEFSAFKSVKLWDSIELGTNDGIELTEKTLFVADETLLKVGELSTTTWKPLLGGLIVFCWLTAALLVAAGRGFLWGKEHELQL